MHKPHTTVWDSSMWSTFYQSRLIDSETLIFHTKGQLHTSCKHTTGFYGCAMLQAERYRANASLNTLEQLESTEKLIKSNNSINSITW